jgi:hypothetical protein
MIRCLVLKRASASRTFGEWRDDDFDVLEGGVIVGRIFMANARRIALGCRQAPTTARYAARRTATNRRARGFYGFD